MADANTFTLVASVLGMIGGVVGLASTALTISDRFRYRARLRISSSQTNRTSCVLPIGNNQTISAETCIWSVTNTGFLAAENCVARAWIDDDSPTPITWGAESSVTINPEDAVELPVYSVARSNVGGNERIHIRVGAGRPQDFAYPLARSITVHWEVSCRNARKVSESVVISPESPVRLPTLNAALPPPPPFDLTAEGARHAE